MVQQGKLSCFVQLWKCWLWVNQSFINCNTIATVYHKPWVSINCPTTLKLWTLHCEPLTFTITLNKLPQTAVLFPQHELIASPNNANCNFARYTRTQFSICPLKEKFSSPLNRLVFQFSHQTKPPPFDVSWWKLPFRTTAFSVCVALCIVIAFISVLWDFTRSAVLPSVTNRHVHFLPKLY